MTPLRLWMTSKVFGFVSAPCFVVLTWTYAPDEGDAHLIELSKLAEKDPEFYKYLQENDRELLEFDPNSADVVDEEEDEISVDGGSHAPTSSMPVLTMKELRQWQRAILEVGIAFFFFLTRIDHAFFSNVL